MNILVINGSPKGERSNTLCITTAFLDGFCAESDREVKVDKVDVSTAHIEHCKGCYCCFTVSPGQCVIQDDMKEILSKMLEADIVLWSFPLYYYGMPSKIKALLDRNLPLNLPFMVERPEGGCTHPMRYDKKECRNILISTCGFYSIENNYDALLKQFEILFGIDYTKIICPEGELFAHPELKNRTDEYLSYAFQAGKEYARKSCITDDTMQKLKELLYSPKAFVTMADASWDIADNDDAEGVNGSSAAERFTIQMAATYNPASYDGRKIQNIWRLIIPDGMGRVLWRWHIA